MRGLAPLLVLAPLLALGSAAAQANLPTKLELALDAPAAPLPLDQATSFAYRLTVTVDAPSTGTLVVEMAAAPPETWAVIFDPAYHEVETGPLPGSHTVEGMVSVRPRGDAPALAPTAIPITAKTSGNALLAPAETTAEALLKAAWRPGLQIVVSSPTVALPRGGGDAPALAEARNTGNGLVVLRAGMLDMPEGCTASPKEEGLRLEPGERLPLRIDVSCADGWASGSLVARYRHALVLDPAQEGTPVEPAWDLRKPGEEGASGPRTFGDEPRGAYESPWPTLAAPAGLMLAALLRRRG